MVASSFTSSENDGRSWGFSFQHLYMTFSRAAAFVMTFDTTGRNGGHSALTTRVTMSSGKEQMGFSCQYKTVYDRVCDFFE